MKAAIVACYFNPCGYHRLRDNCEKFVEGLGEHAKRLYFSSLILDGDSEPILVPPTLSLDRVFFFKGKRPDNVLWQKERLLNAAIARVPAKYDAIVWLDADVIFDNPSWLEDTEKALETYDVVHALEFCKYAGESGGVTNTLKSVVHRERSVSKCWGMAWAARRELIPNGLYEMCIDGSNDGCMTDAWMGHDRPLFKISQRAKEHWRRWKKRQKVKSIGYLTGHSLTHLYHGNLRNRKYSERRNILTRGKYDPNRDIEIENEIMKWKNPDCEMARKIRAWFEGRKEDN